MTNIEALNQEQCEDVISREAAIQATTGMSRNTGTNDEYAQVVLSCLPPVTPKHTIEREFAKWVAEEIFDDNWEYNYGAFAELACRKLEKMGIVKADGDEWHLVESEEDDDEPD